MSRRRRAGTVFRGEDRGPEQTSPRRSVTVRSPVLFLEIEEICKVEIWIFRDDSACQVENRQGKSGNGTMTQTRGSGDLDQSGNRRGDEKCLESPHSRTNSI